MGRETIFPGVELETQEHGPCEGADVLVVWGHGLCGSMGGEDEERLWDFWRPPADDDDESEQFENSTHVVRYSARGHGASRPCSSADEGTWEVLGEDMLALARNKRWCQKHESDRKQKLILGGASMGSASAVFALRRALLQAKDTESRARTQTATTNGDSHHQHNVAYPEIDGLILVIVPTFHEARAKRRTQIEKAIARGFHATAARRKRRPIFKNTDREDEPATPLGVREDSFQHVMTASAKSDLPSLEEMARLFAREVPESKAPPRILILCWDCGDATHPASSAESLREIAPSANVEIATTLQEVNSWGGKIRSFIDEVKRG